MTQYTQTRPGKPFGGLYAFGDTVTDGNGVVWQCVKAGMAGGGTLGAFGDAEFVGSQAFFNSGGTVALAGAPNGATVSALEFSSGLIRHTRLTLADTPITMVDATVQGGGVKIYDFPAGRILVLGCIASLAPKTTTVIADTINSGVAGVWSLGTVVAAANAALTSTEADFLPSTAWTSSTTINVAAATVVGTLAAAAAFDGTTTAIDLYLNACVSGATDIDADGVVAWSGYVEFTWVPLGDY